MAALPQIGSPLASQGGGGAATAHHILKLDLPGPIAEKRMEDRPHGTTEAKKEPARLACEELYPGALACSMHHGSCYAAFVR